MTLLRVVAWAALSGVLLGFGLFLNPLAAWAGFMALLVFMIAVSCGD